MYTHILSDPAQLEEEYNCRRLSCFFIEDLCIPQVMTSLRPFRIEYFNQLESESVLTCSLTRSTSLWGTFLLASIMAREQVLLASSLSPASNWLRVRLLWCSKKVSSIAK